MDQDEEGFVLASMGRTIGDEVRHGLEIQRWDMNPGESAMEKFWLEPPEWARGPKPIGIRSIIGTNKVAFPEVTERLRLKRFQPFATRSIDASTLSLKNLDSRTASSLERVSGERELFENTDSLSKEWENQRNVEEQKFAQRLGEAQTGVVVWSGKTVWWVARNPLALQLDAVITSTMKSEGLAPTAYGSVDRQKLIELLNSLRGREAKTETEFVSLGYLKQRSRKMAGDVLRTWRRIVESGADETGEFRDGEQRVREYLTKIRNGAVVKEYGVWLAARNPRLGVQVFAEDRSQVKFEPSQVVQILREGAPGSVKEYLEYLVFTKNHAEYINELIAYYLDIVTTKLEESPEARSSLAMTYESYRALRPPKPTYRQFITDNTIDEEWWHSRLRLLQLLGGSQGSASRYDVASILERIAPYTNELVPEVIILDGRQSRHEEALRLLTHGLGDYDTAINYCLLGGSSIYHPISGTMAREKLPSREEQAKLFDHLLSEFLRIEDISNRVEQTSSLLERFGGWFEVGHVLSLIPETWSVELVSGFLVSALRRIVRERHETMVAKALSGAENLQVTASLIGEIDKAGPSVET
ncbi:putative Transforming growth factor-beta receptor-associated protein 1 [Glarea lozoyensis 74030]|uniref:Putative Transforming growth factor-beta receptor-associated protein 1 n=1 Tax=Glarea lozoyensis (strain ATCC 74030 / MF5533) TaxID=1104152 RepID=H0EM99_GLAL7|nr:putative Transforming growth factor-beta receptor-associated protein 1 [Glarea lozoyensis 74030]